MPITEQRLLQILPNAGRQAGNEKGTDLFNYHPENKSVPFVEVKPKKWRSAQWPSLSRMNTEPVARELAPVGLRSSPMLLKQRAGAASQPSGSKLPRHGLAVPVLSLN